MTPGSGAPRPSWPIALLDLDLADPPARIEALGPWGEPCERAWITGWRDGVPVGLAEVDVADGSIDSALVLPVLEPAGSGPPPGGVSAGAESDITVVICTRDNPDGLGRTLESLTTLRRAPAAVVVADNLSVSTRVREVAEDYAARLPVEYHRVGPAGLSNARNAALGHVRTPLVAWIDDDEQVAPTWLEQIVAAFAYRPEAVAVSGVVLPAEFRTEAQYLFELYGGHVKGRGFTLEVFEPTAMVQSPLFPLPPFGVGANMAFRTEALRSIGGFDPALGAGTPTRAGEDTAVFSRLLLAGRTTVYWPWAATRHVHRASLDALVDQVTGYARGLTAYYTSMALSDPRTLATMARLAPAALRVARGKQAGDAHPLPGWLAGRKRSAMVAGPGLYLRTRLLARLRQGA